MSEQILRNYELGYWGQQKNGWQKNSLRRGKLYFSARHFFAAWCCPKPQNFCSSA
jgi:hypothetical protein